jgi:hypothetical protein
MTGRIKYQFTSEIWVYPGKGGWHFVSLPQELSKEIREILKSEEQGWGRLKVKAKIGNSEWDTAIWFDTKMGTYILPLKAEIRKKEKLEADKEVEVSILI